jgi:DNA end-binding protein Ku
MVSIPVRLYPAVRKKSISFNQLDEATMSRIRYRKVSEATGEEVPAENIVKGYDVGGESYVIVTDEDLAPLTPRKSKEIDLQSFVPEEDVDPMMFDASYIVAPDKAAKPYALLANALAGSGRVGIGRFVMRQKEYLTAVRSDGAHLTLSTLVFPDELVDVDSVDGFDALDGVDVSSKELLMAKSLVEALSEDFDPTQYHDEYREGVEKIIEAKAAGKTPVYVEEPEERAEVIDLAAALEASLRDAKAARAKHPAAALKAVEHDDDDDDADDDGHAHTPAKKSTAKATKTVAKRAPAKHAEARKTPAKKSPARKSA